MANRAVIYADGPLDQVEEAMRAYPGLLSEGPNRTGSVAFEVPGGFAVVDQTPEGVVVIADGVDSDGLAVALFEHLQMMTRFPLERFDARFGDLVASRSAA